MKHFMQMFGVLLLSGLEGMDAEEVKSIYSCDFKRDGWNQKDWLLVRSPRWLEMSHWEQYDDCIGNYVPADLRPEDMQMGRDRTGESYISMLLKQPVLGSARISTVCAFDSRMAPLIVLSKDLNPVHQEHLEVVLYDKGVNLWHHYWIDGKPSWKLIGFIDLDLKQGSKYELTAEIYFNKKGCFLTMGCNGRTFGCRLEEGWPQNYYVGITGCEGRNRFFSFIVEYIVRLFSGDKVPELYKL